MISKVRARLQDPKKILLWQKTCIHVKMMGTKGAEHPYPGALWDIRAAGIGLWIASRGFMNAGSAGLEKMRKNGRVKMIIGIVVVVLLILLAAAGFYASDHLPGQHCFCMRENPLRIFLQ